MEGSAIPWKGFEKLARLLLSLLFSLDSKWLFAKQDPSLAISDQTPYGNV